MVLYGVLWPHLALFIASHSKHPRRVEMRLLMLDAAASGAAIALTSFQTVPMLCFFIGYATILGSVGGVPLLLAGMSILVASTLLTGATVTNFSVSSDTPFNTATAGFALFGFQAMMGILTHRTARSLVRHRKRIAEQGIEIQRQNEEVIAAREEALQAAQAKAAFLATMSHEIRTPLNGVLGMTRLLSETSLNAEQHDFVRTIQVSGTTLLTVINDILDYSRIESGRMELEQEPFGVRAVVEEALEMVGSRAREQGIELVCEVAPDVPELVLGDATRVRQILTNLAGNAVKFTKSGEVVVSVRQSRSAAEDVPAELLFTVRDTGIGIPADRIPILFTPFSQADASTTRRYGGTGLGLAISRRLSELMGGTISVESKDGEGSTFTFTIQLPLAPDRRSSPREPAAAISGRHVLVVDDNATNRRVLCAQLKLWGMKPRAEENAAAALQALRGGEQFSLAILDLHMPEVDGMTLAHQIREEARFDSLPLILLSSSLVQSKDDPQRLFHARLMKPVRQSKLFDSIIGVLDHSAVDRVKERTSPGSEQVPLTTPLRILVADDNEINRKLAALVLRRLGYENDFVENGREALDAVVAAAGSDRPYDLVFMDVQMPEMDGLEATRRIRQKEADLPQLRWPRIVAMTADAMPEDREICLRSGMNDYLTKPLDFDAVRTLLVTTAALVVEEARPAAQPDSKPAETTQFVDWSRLDEIRTYDTPDGAVIKEIISSFLHEARKAMLQVRSSAVARDGQALRSSAHALKGVALNVGATAIAECAARLEDAAKANAFDGIEVLVENLTRSFEPTINELNCRVLLDTMSEAQS